MKLTTTTQKFVLHWGEMGTRWGINRSVAQIHALLMVAPGPIAAEEIAETLALARSNVSTGIKELQGWGIVKTVHLLGDRRDHFVTQGDVWEMFLHIMRERRKREINPSVVILHDCLASGKIEKDIDATALKRISDLAEFMEDLGKWCDLAQNLSPAGAKRLAQLSG